MLSSATLKSELQMWLNEKKTKQNKTKQKTHKSWFQINDMASSVTSQNTFS